MSRARQVITTVLAAILSLLLAFFVVFNAIFSDVFRFSQHLLLFPYVLLVYGVFGFMFSLIAPELWRRWTRIFSWPAVAIVILYSLQEFGPRIVLHVTYATIAVTGVTLGSWAGMATRFRRQPQHPARIWAQANMRKIFLMLLGLAVVGMAVSSQVAI